MKDVERLIMIFGFRLENLQEARRAAEERDDRHEFDNDLPYISGKIAELELVLMTLRETIKVD